MEVLTEVVARVYTRDEREYRGVPESKLHGERPGRVVRD
jgi:hypothetical protein